MLIYYAVLHRIKICCATQKVALNGSLFCQSSLYPSMLFISIDTLVRWRERWHIMCSSSACVHTYLPNQNVLFIHILLWKLMLKYFIAEHCRKIRKKYLENFYFPLFPSSLALCLFFFPPARNMFALCSHSWKVLCLLSIKHLQASQILSFLFKKIHFTKSDFVYAQKCISFLLWNDFPAITERESVHDSKRNNFIKSFKGWRRARIEI